MSHIIVSFMSKDHMKAYLELQSCQEKRRSLHIVTNEKMKEWIKMDKSRKKYATTRARIRRLRILVQCWPLS